MNTTRIRRSAAGGALVLAAVSSGIALQTSAVGEASASQVKYI